MSMNSSTSPGGDRRNNAGGGSGVSSGPCGACKFLRRKCLSSCIFAPYFDPENGANHFASVHKIFGASNVSKLLVTIPIHMRPDAVLTIVYEAQARMRDPIYGCVSHIFTLQQQITTLQNELSYLQAQLAELPQPPPPLQQAAMAAAMPATYDLSTLFDPMAQQSPRNMMQQRAMDLRYQYVGGSTLAGGNGGGSGVVSSVGGGGGNGSGVSAAAGGGSGVFSGVCAGGSGTRVVSNVGVGGGGGSGNGVSSGSGTRVVSNVGVGAGGGGGGGDLHALAREFLRRIGGNASGVAAPSVAGTNASLSPSSAK
ncbi:hypothetical protein TanjilG_20270 [Lupinus angustifolius]|uniref:LOB domain-containing protein n=1 Tax=Lupinus angustifolius TaxID=3871 RepID=A0A1J7IUT1_LUPAN|nr:PREDICTED: LOB domain-containing protein 30-like [Lupinus angustifolius]OIW18997.1 hypothetical protein TanjilG_20270 [Lupinus angustifolius]